MKRASRRLPAVARTRRWAVAKYGRLAGEFMGGRHKTPESVEASVLVKSKRRCCLCVFLQNDDSVKRGQIAHINRDPGDNSERNLVFLCLDHHDEYDGRTSVSKGLTKEEVRRYRDLLYKNYEDEVSRPLWNVPYPRNDFFTGREEFLDQLHRALTSVGSAAISQAIAGLGGVGKTQTAVEYAYRHRDEYKAVFWVNAAEAATLLAGYGEIANMLDLPVKNERDQEIIVNAVNRWLESRDGWLLVLDNADDPADVEPFLPNESKGHILVTSRADNFDMLRIPEPLELTEMPPDEAEAFLIHRTGRGDENPAEREAVRALAEELGYLPLALEQAAAYIAAPKCSFTDYLKSYQTRRLALLRTQKPVMGRYPDSVVTTWAANFEAVEQASPAAADVLRLSSLLAPDEIPYEILTEGAAELGPNVSKALDGVSNDPLLLDDLIAPLTRYRLVRRGPTGWSVHRLVQAVVGEGMTDPARKEWAERAVNALNSATPYVEFAVWPLCERLAPHHQACAERIERNAMETPQAARLLNRAGFYLAQRARYAEAEPLHRRALDIYEKVLGPEHPDTAMSLNNLADLLLLKGEYAQAEPLFRRALEIREKALGPEHPNTARSLNNLAALLESKGEYAEAESLFRRALKIRKKELGSEHPRTAQSLSNLADLLRSKGEYAEAEPLYRRALDICEKALGPEHPDTATSLNNLAALLQCKGEYAKAEPLHREALDIYEKALGPKHPNTAASLWWMAIVSARKGEPADAEDYYLRALSIYEASLGRNHPRYTNLRAQFAAFLREQGRAAEAEEAENSD